MSRTAFILTLATLIQPFPSQAMEFSPARQPLRVAKTPGGDRFAVALSDGAQRCTRLHNLAFSWRCSSFLDGGSRSVHFGALPFTDLLRLILRRLSPPARVGGKELC